MIMAKMKTQPHTDNDISRLLPVLDEIDAAADRIGTVLESWCKAIDRRDVELEDGEYAAIRERIRTAGRRIEGILASLKLMDDWFGEAEQAATNTSEVT